MNLALLIQAKAIRPITEMDAAAAVPAIMPLLKPPPDEAGTAVDSEGGAVRVAVGWVGACVKADIAIEIVVVCVGAGEGTRVEYEA